MNLPDTEMFSFKEGIIGGDECILINPNDIKCKWSEDTLKYRSIIIRKTDGKIISRGYDKFFNFTEQPDLNKFPDGAFNVVEKKDGSLIIWGIHNNELIHRTRGTFNAENMANGHEIQFLKGKYPKLIEAIGDYSDCSILTEWQTKTNVIVINEVTEPTLTLVGIIHNETGHLWHQGVLDELAVEWGIDRPTKYHYASISECLADVDLWEDKEGVVLYSECGQYLRKIKSCWYCELHKLATGIKGINQVLDVFMASPKFMDEKEFYNYISTTLDFEIAEKCKDFIKEVCEAYTYFINTEMFIRSQVDVFIRPLETRKEQALALQQQFSGWKLAYAFQYLSYKNSDDKQILKAMRQILTLD
jgi:T4 RnlA family RNA ligase